jgi:hypothetical protein
MKVIQRDYFFRKIKFIAAAVASSLLMIAAPASALTIGGPSDCDDNAVIRCGVHSVAEIQSSYKNSQYTKDVYQSFGIFQSDINEMDTTAVSGQVTKSGSVTVNGVVVAKSAMTAGRQNISGSVESSNGNSTFFKRPPSVSFQSAELPSFVVIKNGEFQFAVIASCGNPVVATPVRKPQPQPQAAPTPTPPPAAPVQEQQQQQQQVVVQQVPPAPQQQQQQQQAAPAPAPAPAQPSALVNTGATATGAIGLFSAASVSGYLLWRRHLSRQL